MQRTESNDEIVVFLRARLTRRFYKKINIYVKKERKNIGIESICSYNFILEHIF